MNRKLLSLLLTLTLVIGLAIPMAAATAAGPLDGKLVILHTNDIHGRGVADTATGALGYAAIAEQKDMFESLGASVLLLDAGDASQGTSLVNMSMGKTAMEFMSAAGYDAMSPGNHEFDWGLDNLLQIRESANFPILAANILRKDGSGPVFEANKIFDMPNGMKVGVFGLDTPETLTKTHPDKVQGITFLQGDELYACAQAQVDELKAAGCDVIICLGHLGDSDESAPNRSIDLIPKVTGIDLFIDAHSHTTIGAVDETGKAGEMIGDTLRVSTGQYCQKLGIVTYDGTAFSATLRTFQDTEVKALVDGVNGEITKVLSEVFAKTEVDLNGERDPGVRTQETNLGDFAADAILWAAQQAMGDQVVAAITNGGGIRTSIKTGDITMNSMKTVFPFGNVVATLTVTGAELLEALEAATHSTPSAIGAFPQVAGIEFTINTSVPYEQGEQYPDSTYFKPAKPGSRVTIATVGGQPFDPAAEYVIATNDFTAAGGDTYYAFRYAYKTTGYATGVALEDALVQYVQTVLGGVVGAQYAEPAGRITIQ